jgi:hypothetical protein
MVSKYLAATTVIVFSLFGGLHGATAQECAELEQCLMNAGLGMSDDRDLSSLYAGNWADRKEPRSRMAESCDKFAKGSRVFRK